MPRRKSRKSRKGRRKRGGGAGCSLEDSNKMIIQNGGGLLSTITDAFTTVGDAVSTATTKVKTGVENTASDLKSKAQKRMDNTMAAGQNLVSAAKGEEPVAQEVPVEPQAPVEPASEVPVEDSEISSEVSTEPVMVGPPEALGELDSEEEEKREHLANMEGGRRRRKRRKSRKTKRKTKRKQKRKTKRRSKKRRRRRTRRRRGGMCGCEKK